jgi:DNA primase
VEENLLIPREKIDEIRDKSDIVNVISEYVSLKKRGRNYLGLCPFHSEKDASFTVSPEKQLFHCFGCGEGGNVFAFLMKIENLGFAEAVAELGSKVGIVIERAATAGTSKTDKDKLYDVLSLAGKFFIQCLEEDPGKDAREYLKQRGIKEETAKAFMLGFAPGGWDHLFKHLLSRGAAPKSIEIAGLTLPRENQDGYYDRFRNRLIFPVCDTRGRVIAFSGRALDGKEPKYLNSPDTPVYRKGETIFGLHLTKDPIKKEKAAVLVEGNLDLLTAYQAGIAHVAAPLGTALTASQCKLLSRFTDTVVLAFDSDAAGELAAERCAELLRSQGLKVKIAVIRGAKDPDELIQKAGADAFKKTIASALPFLEFKIRRAIARNNPAEIEGRSQALREIADILTAEKDSFTQGEYAKLAARLLNIDPETILSETKRVAYYRQRTGKDLRRYTEKPLSGLAEAEKYLLALATQDKTVLEKMKEQLTPEDFVSPEGKKVAGLLLAGEAGEMHFILENLADESARNFLAGALLGANLENAQKATEDCISVIKAERTKNRVGELRSKLLEAEKAGETQKAAEFLAALKGEISWPPIR